MKTFGTEFNFTVRGPFPKKTKFLTKFQRFATSDRHNSAMITDRRKLVTKIQLRDV